MDWSLSRAAMPGQETIEGLSWAMECLQAGVVVVLCTIPDLLLRQVSSLMATSRVVSLVATLLIVTLVGIYMLHLEMLADVLSGKITEVFGCGTAAVIAPVGKFGYKDEEYIINNYEVGPVAKRLYDELTGIQYGRIPDRFGWTMMIEAK